MIDVLLASQNKGKLKEFRQILEPLGFNVKSLVEYGLENVDVEETGDTFEKNALIKAEAIKKLSGVKLVIADDSGLCVDSINGDPGIYSARYAGEPKDDNRNNLKLLEELKNYKGKENRKAKFVCAIALVGFGDLPIIVRGECYGYIADEPRGTNGFGYDPLFVIEEYNKSIAEISPEIKNRISHRYNALKLLQNEIKSIKF